ncbi:MAG TPA: hypothetical protein VGE21_10735 [Flavobacteriales bacterium]
MGEVLLPLLYTGLFLLVIQRWGFFAAPGLGKGTISGLFLLKIAAGTALWWVYTAHYTDRATADIYKYFDDGNVLFSALPERPADYLRMLFGVVDDRERFDTQYFRVMNNWYRQYEGALYNDAHTMIRFNAVVRLFSFGSYHVHTVFACFLGLIGLTALYKAFVRYLPGLEWGLLFAVFLLPTVLFWGSGVLKESLLLLGIGPLVAAGLRIAEREVRWTIVLRFLLSAFLLCFLKIYVLMALLPGLIAVMWHGTAPRPGAWWRFGTVHLVCLVLALNSELLLPGFDLLEVIRVKQKDMIDLVAEIPTGSYVPTEKLAATPISFLINAPHALFLTFLSPFLMLGSGALGLVTAAENALPFLALAFTLPFAKRRKDIAWPLVLFCLLYVLVLGLIIGWTTPVIGALVRYRLPFFPFLFIGLLLIIDPQRLPAWNALSRKRSTS